MKIKQKLILFIVVPVALIFIFGLGFMISKVRSSMYSEVERNLNSLSQKYVNDIKGDLRHLTVSAEEISHIMVSLKESGASREQIDEALKKVIEKDDFLFALYTIWEPNSLDGKDDQYKDAPGHNSDGRYCPWVARTTNGESAIQACTAEGGYLEPGGFYLGTKDLGKPRFLDPATWTFQGKKVTIVDYIYPLYDEGQFLGIMSTELELSGIRQLISDIKPLGTGYASILTNSGVYIATDDESKLGKEDDRKKVLSKLKALKGSQTFSITADDKTGETMLHQFSPIDIGIEGFNWVLETVVPLDKAMASIHKITTTMIIFALLGVLLILAIVWFMAQKLSAPLKEVVEIAQKAESGDISAEILDENIKTKDEIGQLMRSVGAMMESQRLAIRKVLSCADNTNSGTENLAALAEESHASMEEITEAIKEIAHLSEENSETINQLNHMIDELSATTDATAKATVKGAETTEEVTRISEETREKVQEATRKMKKLNEMTGDNKNKADMLSSSVEQISHFITTITGIADQTNLLALNAAIEAARAGDAGRGFAVVADEVRKLAEESNDAALKIADLIKSLRSNAEDSKQMAIRSETMIEDTLEDSHKIEEEISHMVESVRVVAKEIQNIAAAAQEQAAAAHEMAQNTNSVAEKSNAVSDQVQVTKASLEQTAIVSNTVAEEAENLARIAEELHQSVEFFKVDRRSAIPEKL